MSIPSQKPEGPIDRLMDADRVSTRVLREGQEVTREGARAVIEAFTAFKARTNVSNAYAARCLGISPVIFCDVLQLRYGGNWQEVIQDLDRWLEEEDKRERAPKPTAFVWTKVAMEIQTVAEAAITLKTIGLVFGDSGIGKSLALQAIAAEKPGSVFISVETASATGPGIIDALGRPLRAQTGARYASSRFVLERIKDELRGTSRLIIIDEVHKLCTDQGSHGDDRALHILRDLHDHTGVPMLLCGTTDLTGYLERRQVGGREPLGQIRRRIGICRNLAERTQGGDGGPGEPLFSAEEVRRVFSRSKLRLAPDAAHYLMLVANLPGSGGLGTCRNLVVMARKVHGDKSGPLTAAMLRAVHRLLVNGRTFDQLTAQMQPPARVPAVATVAKAAG
jgi:DNA transposition AAA+ family ATPase